MSDDEIAALLRSESSVVVIEAPAGCGKTFQAASYAADMSSRLKSGKTLVLTHTHAACSVIAEATHQVRNQVEIQTLDSLINQIATAYRILLELPEDIAMWARENGYETLADKVAILMRRNPMICRHLALRYPIIICDEHQDSNESQDEIVRLINREGSYLRVFGDPMQIIPAGRTQDSVVTETESRWESLKTIGEFGEMRTPHRWEKTNPELGKWILQSRQRLKEGRSLNLSTNTPAGLNVIYAENGAEGGAAYRLVPGNWSEVNSQVDENSPMLILAGQTRTVLGLRSSFRRRFPIWEGHTRPQLEVFLKVLSDESSDTISKTKSFISFLQEIMIGFSNSKYGNRLVQEIEKLTENSRGNIPPQLNKMAQLILAEPDHHGFSKAALHLKELCRTKSPGFDEGLSIDYPRELGDLIKLAKFDDPIIGFAEVSQRLSRAHPKPPRKALSTVHKAKGLEADCVVVLGCDEKHFPGRKSKSNLLYVALSRATKKVTIVLSKNEPSPFLQTSG